MVLRQVCLDVASWQHDLPAGFRVHVNLSPAQLSDGHFLSLLDHWLARTGTDPNRLGFEITEPVILDDHDAVRTVIAGLKQRGCHVALDDFGTGYSSLAHLRSVLLDLLKTDRAFVADLEDHSRDRAIVAAVAGLAQELGVPVLAQGVETEAGDPRAAGGPVCWDSGSAAGRRGGPLVRAHQPPGPSCVRSPGSRTGALAQ